MISFESDYINGTHPEILKQLFKTNSEVMSGYGNDPYNKSACEKIRNACTCADADIYFMVGGTQTNSVIISSVLDNYEGVIAAATGHVSTHEAGAIEYTGHKVLTLPEHDGKIDSEELSQYLHGFYNDENRSHMVFPGMVYISHPTEFGTLYTKTELKQISAACNKYKIPLFLDGARLGYALAANCTDVSFSDIAQLCDIFYIGGTKVGALCGEAVVFTKRNTPKQFITQIKQHGALLAKGRLLSIQFDTLFTDNLYMDISRNAIAMAERIKNIFKSKGYKLFIDSPTNQQFIILENNKIDTLREKVSFGIWDKYDENHTIVRFVTSWSTTKHDVDTLESLL